MAEKIICTAGSKFSRIAWVDLGGKMRKRWDDPDRVEKIRRVAAKQIELGEDVPAETIRFLKRNGLSFTEIKKEAPRSDEVMPAQGSIIFNPETS